MRMILIGLALALVAAPALAQTPQQRDWCFSSTATDDQTIDGCTALIQSAQEPSANQAAAYDNRGWAYEHKHLYDQAIADYRAVLKINPNWLGAWNSLKRLGVSAPFASAASAPTQEQHDWCYSPTASDDQTIDGCTALIQSGQQTTVNLAAAYDARSDAYVNKGLYDQAIADENQALALNPNDPAAYNNRGNAYGSKGLYDQAIADYTRAIALKPDNNFAYYERGNDYRRKGLRDQAIADFRAALKLDPNMQAARAELTRLGVSAPFASAASAASAQTQQQRDGCNSPTAADDQRIEGCTALIQSAQETSATKAGAYSNRGAAYVHKGLYDQAIADYTQAIALKPNDAVAYQGRGIAYDGKFLHDQAIADYTAAIALKPEFADAYNMRGLSHMEMGLYDLAIGDFTRAIALKRGFAQFHYNRAFAYDVKGHHRDQAVADYRAALKINPNLQAARDGLKRDGARRRKGRGHARVAHHGG